MEYRIYIDHERGIASLSPDIPPSSTPISDYMAKLFAQRAIPQLPESHNVLFLANHRRDIGATALTSPPEISEPSERRISA